jgi:hypothetical protein
MRDATDAVRQWATDLLDLPPSRSSHPTEALEQARSVFLKGLPDQDFVPSISEQTALTALQGQIGPEVVALAQARYERLLEERIHQFGIALPALSPQERTDAWKQLSESAHGLPRLQRQLIALRAALEVPSPSAEEPVPIRELTAHLFELVRLGPAARAVRRRELLIDMRRDHSTWERAANYLRTMRPATAELDLELIDQLEGREPARRRQRRLALQGQINRPSQVPPTVSVSPANGNDNSASVLGNGRVIFVCILIITGALRIASSNMPSQPKPVLPPDFFLAPKGPEMGDPAKMRDLLENMKKWQVPLPDLHDLPKPGEDPSRRPDDELEGQSKPNPSENSRANDRDPPRPGGEKPPPILVPSITGPKPIGELKPGNDPGQADRTGRP